MKVYTKTGDSGTTSLIGGTRVQKNDVRLEAYGTIDELNSFIGLLACSIHDEKFIVILEQIQNTLFDIGGILATDLQKTPPYVQVNKEEVSRLENQIDSLFEQLPELKSFVLPGGTKTASLSHVCRTIARRAERNLYTMKQYYPIEENILTYINRLSDYFFVLARYFNSLVNVEKIYIKKGN